MHFFRDSGISSVLESSFTPRKLRLSALASCVALPSESIQSSGRCLTSTDGGNAESCLEQLLSLLSQKNYYF